MLRKVFGPASVKKTHVYQRSYSPQWRADVTVLDYDRRGRHLIIGVVVGFSCVSSLVKSLLLGEHTTVVEVRRKITLYGDLTTHRLVPFVVGAFGGLGAQAKKFLEECAERRRDRLGPEIISATWSTPTFMSYWEHTRMVALQGAQAFGLHGRALEDFPQHLCTRVGLQLEEVDVCPFSSDWHVPTRAKNAYGEAMRRGLRGVFAGDWELLYRTAAPSAPPV
ncbi:hypothetical protein CYMTET_9391 [Cymbomonas tetramitiformis]|uniref:Uncharacterized protein n=1 Tax=Cymbomonas tetramitiformis TaxID=36881 RepID=A0AAE0LF23_9CHLO|nr:hypothetical protein CYMTET_9391 [Cymbomonas tetramitiformis]